MRTNYVNMQSTAYDLDKFLPRQRPVRKPTLTVTRPAQAARERARIQLGLKITACLALVITVLVTMLYSRAVLTELSRQIEVETENLNNEISEGTRLNAELESKVSLRNVEEYATQKLGMATMDKEQVTYVDLSEGDKIELTQSSPKQTIFDRIQLAISNVKEYMGKD